MPKVTMQLHPNDPVTGKRQYYSTTTGKPVKRRSASNRPTIPTQQPFTPQELKRIAGAPSKYKPTYAKQVILDLAAGYSLSGFAGKLGVTRATLDNWMRLYPDFMSACSRAGAVRLRYWEGKAIEIAETGGVGSQAQMVIFGLKNAGADEWRDKVEQTVNVQVTLASLIEDSMKLVSPAQSRTIDALPSEVKDLDARDKAGEG